jgi:DNA invertase Pin-like site-specific DNA recombinase
MACKLVPYRRVSTQSQGESGLGLEAQDAAIQAYAQMTGCKVIASYCEVETGKRDDMENRPELLKAIAHAKRSKATLVIAKMDRLARSVYVLAELHKSGVDFVACDNPNANRLTVQILMAVAENEARQISERTKAALAAYKANNRVSKRIKLLYPDGVPTDVAKETAGKLGASLRQCRNLTDDDRKKGNIAAADAKREATRNAYADLVPIIQELAARTGEEKLSQAEIANELNRLGHTTTSGAPWTQAQVSRMIARAKS